jgi:hypothetical protein
MKAIRFSLAILACAAACAAAGSMVTAQRRGTPPTASTAASGVLPRTIAAANTFLGLLDETQRAKAQFPFDSPQKTNWSNLPSGIFQRHSLRLGDMTAAERDSAFALMSTVLSRDGYDKITKIMNGDEVLKNQGGGRTGGRPGGGAPRGGAPAAGPGGPPPARGGGGRGGGVVFGKDEYYLAILGTPSATAPWMIQFGGHHLGINVTIAGAQSTMAPSLPAAQPAKYTLNGETIRPLGRENDKGFVLINALDAAQQKQAILPYQVSDLVLGPLQDGKVIQPEGILASAMNANQQGMLLDLAHEWVGILNDDAAAERMAEIRANLPKTYFAWSGATTNGGLAYYRIQGPTLVIEYAPQQGDVDHIHTIYRDPTNDYGARLVAK